MSKKREEALEYHSRGRKGKIEVKKDLTLNGLLKVAKNLK